MKAHYDEEADTLTLVLRDVPVAESDEDEPGGEGGRAPVSGVGGAASAKFSCSWIPAVGRSFFGSG